DFRDVANKKQLRADIFDVVAKFAMGEPVAGETVDDPERRAEIVVETGPDDACWQRMPDIADVLAYLIPGVGDFLRVCAAFQVDEDRGEACLGIAAQEVEMRCFLQSTLESLRHLLERVLDGCSRPGGLDHHGLDDEGGVLAAPKTEIGYDAGND